MNASKGTASGRTFTFRWRSGNLGSEAAKQTECLGPGSAIRGNSAYIGRRRGFRGRLFFELGLLGIGHPTFDAKPCIEQADVRKSCMAQHCHLLLG